MEKSVRFETYTEHGLVLLLLHYNGRLQHRITADATSICLLSVLPDCFNYHLWGCNFLPTWRDQWTVCQKMSMASHLEMVILIPAVSHSVPKLGILLHQLILEMLSMDMKNILPNVWTNSDIICTRSRWLEIPYTPAVILFLLALWGFYGCSQ